MNNAPFIKLHSNKIEILINIQQINYVAQYYDNKASIYLNYREAPLYIDEPYQEVKKKIEYIAGVV